MVLNRLKYVNKIKVSLKTMYQQTERDNKLIDDSMECIENYDYCYWSIQCMLIDYFNHGLWKVIYSYLTKYNKKLYNKYTLILRGIWV